ncbi:unnamed protein product [Parnassius mnemosyne]|uniref:Major facilitator superfamily (MFS) profile domain-containing protein n=1 Tax=Parnassius mnemosyne TaxID=213953 RepID=A0AAV1LBE4_9NEOP
MLEVINWVIITFSYNVEAILAAIFLSGLCRCMLLVVPIYVSEICQDSIRGMMTSGAMVFHSIGMLVSYLMGGYLSYDNMNYVCLSITVLEVVFLYFLKESPMHLMRKGHKKEAAQAIAFYRGTSVNSKLVEEELQKLRRALNTDLGDATPEEEKLTSELKENPKLSTWQFLKKSRSTRRALFMILVLNAAVIFQGLIVVQVYAGPLYAEAVPSMSPTICSVIFTLVTITSGFIGAFLIERAGRRPLMIYASFATGVCCMVLGTQIQLHWGPHWVTAMFMYIFGVTYSCGSGTVPCVLLAEIFLPEIKSIASMIVIQWSLVCSFIVLFIFNPLVTTIGLGPVFYFFAFACFFSAIFCKFFLPETKGLTVDVIQILFAKRIVRQRHVVNTEITF